MDPDFLLLLDPKLMVLSPSNLRRDPSFSAQLYFVSFQEMGPNTFGLYLYQVVASSASANDPSVRTVRFLKRKTSGALALPSRDGNTPPPPTPDIIFAIDEPAAKLYISFGNDCAETKLRVMDIEFDPADHLGYRRVRVKEQNRLFVVKITPTVPSVLGAINISPVTGKVFGHYTIVSSNRNIICKSTVARFEPANNSVIRARISDHKFTMQNSTRDLDARYLLFTKLDHLLILYGFEKEDKPQANKCMFLVSYDTNLNLLRSLAFNPADFVNKFLSADVMSDFYESRRAFSSESYAVGSCLEIKGHMHKYVLFSFNGYILAVKWPRDWYTGKNLPPIQLSRVIDLGDFITVEDYRKIPVPMAVDTHLFMAFQLPDKPIKIRRLALSPRFKDYRHCANCGEVEKSKRRNKEGKRIAKFKVCRLCKKNNFHLFHLEPEIACHYCSDECQKKHWKLHKHIHKRSKINRKSARAITVVEKF